MGGYTQRVRDSILPLSVAGTLPAAFGEWSFTDNTFDHEQPIETCELCGQQDLRTHAFRSALAARAVSIISPKAFFTSRADMVFMAESCGNPCVHLGQNSSFWQRGVFGFYLLAGVYSELEVSPEEEGE